MLEKGTTPHINAAYGDFAKTVLMPGDPMRAKFIAENFLNDAKLVSDVRGMFAYTGFYKNEKISVMGSGMGVPSIGIYAHELYNCYDVSNIIRIGTCGAVSKSLNLLDIVVSVGASYDTNFDAQYCLPGKFSATADFELLKAVDIAAISSKTPVTFGRTVTCDSFYGEKQTIPAWAKMGILAVEMEAAGLYMSAAANGKSALALMTIVDSMFTDETISSAAREKSLTDMILLSLETALLL